MSLSKSFFPVHMLVFFHPAIKQESSKICRNIGLRRSLSLSNFFDSDNERLNPIFSLSKKFDSDNDFLIYMKNVIKYICLFYF
jgi:hypothetical protein